MINGEEMPRKKKEEFGLGDALMLIALILLIWLLLKSLGLVDPPENISTYILEGILGAMILAWFTDIREIKKKAIRNSEELAAIKAKLSIIEKQI